MRCGSILGIVLGVLSTLFWGNLIFVRSLAPVFSVNLFELFLLLVSIGAIISCYYLYTRFPPRIENDPSNTGLVLVGLGIFVAIGSWGIAGLLLVISGILILIDETS
ncbi:MAG: hypothetical protein Q6364_04645 [Candidatus Hermodarchaeota archaeon]|nr:hypothetical protein [Candidatus Hermodarchaeota archaeon]